MSATSHLRHRLASTRTRDVHNCPSGATGSGYCRHTTSSRMSDTYTYNGTSSELMTRCRDTEGTWYSE